jgi:hypothetical protein
VLASTAASADAPIHPRCLARSVVGAEPNPLRSRSDWLTVALSGLKISGFQPLAGAGPVVFAEARIKTALRFDMVSWKPERFNHFDFVLWRKRTTQKDSEGEDHVPSVFFVGVEADFEPG